MTKERLEHELLKIKSQVGPEHVGIPFIMQDPLGRRCIMGQILSNVYGRVANDLNWMDLRYGKETQPLIEAAINMNNMGVRWHQIIDTLVPQAEVPAEILEEMAA